MGRVSRRQPLIHRPDPGYGDRNYLQLAELFGPIAYVLRARAALLRDLGPSLSPQNAFQLLQGLETLPLRIQRQFDNAAKVANTLAAHPKVAKVISRAYRPASTGSGRTNISSSDTAVSSALSRSRAKRGRSASSTPKAFYHLANIGDARSLAIHPRSTTHGQLNMEQQTAAGISPAFVRYRSASKTRTTSSPTSLRR